MSATNKKSKTNKRKEATSNTKIYQCCECQIDFTSDDPEAGFCSTSCKEDHHTRNIYIRGQEKKDIPLKERYCMHCREKFMPDNNGNHFCSTECLRVKHYYQSPNRSWEWIRENVFTSKQITKQLLNSDEEDIWAILFGNHIDNPLFVQGTFKNIRKYIEFKYSEANVTLQRIKDDIIQCNEETIDNLSKQIKKVKPNKSIKCIIEGVRYSIEI